MHDMYLRKATELSRKTIRYAASHVKLDVELGDVHPGELDGFISGYFVGRRGWRSVFDNEDVGEAAGLRFENPPVFDFEDRLTDSDDDAVGCSILGMAL
ncbi:OLC1v1025475C1 [Oldenlandia corymbosa var. corymbosa]|uniref:OLC1v1025475C1 n=1 Tax=Oldenlandia corymbosa var. corymbosa TaxID=529605 RepID=A0AAV1C7X9_OLDCO|nr:OLC1v1025475C1 [Oldenlandia corymbosa var. corymbosa]